MRCHACEYPLWNLAPGPCPECGRPFRSDEFEFEPNTVVFICGDCGAEHPGRGERGLPDPPAFFCGSCGAPCVCGDMVVAPTDRIDPLASRGLLPWLDRGLDAGGVRRRGPFNRFFRTIWWFTARGWSAADGIPASASTASAWWFALITLAMVSAFQVLPFAFFFGWIGGPFPGGIVGAWPLLVGVVLICLALLAGSVFTVVVTGLATHGLLLLTGACRQGLGRTMQAVLYPVAVMSWAIVPCCMPLSFGVVVWSAVVVCGTVQRMQRVSWRRACFAALTPTIALYVVLPVGLWFQLSMVPAAVAPVKAPLVLPAVQTDAVPATEDQDPAVDPTPAADRAEDSDRSGR